VFARLLDHRRGGYFRVAPENENYVVKQLYFPETAVLITRFMSEDGVAELVDFMPIADDPKVVSDRHRIVRIVRGVRGEMHLSFDCAPRFDYARASHSVHITEHGAVLDGGDLKLTLHGAEGLERHGEEDVRVIRTVRANETVGVILESAAETPRRTGVCRRVDAVVRTNGAVLARLAWPVYVSRALARDGRPLGNDAEADDLRTDGCSGGGTDDCAA
jgi:GH15 family glucan-1,4-alpha-glucosidase